MDARHALAQRILFSPRSLYGCVGAGLSEQGLEIDSVCSDGGCLERDNYHQEDFRKTEKKTGCLLFMVDSLPSISLVMSPGLIKDAPPRNTFWNVKIRKMEAFSIDQVL
jgi:hypothetical protein